MALVLGFLPAAIVALVFAIFVAFILIVILLLSVLDKPVTCWFYYASLIFNVLVLVPLAVVSYAASKFEPDLWSTVRNSVFIFSVVFVSPTILFRYYCQKHIYEETIPRGR